MIQSYWLGLYKITASPSSASYWYATGWYSGSTSRYRAWARGYPRHKYDTCVLYTSDGWKDSPCSIPCYFSCKKPAGTAVHGCSGGEGARGSLTLTLTQQGHSWPRLERRPSKYFRGAH